MKYNTLKTVEDCFLRTGRDPKALPDVSMLPEADRGHMVNNYKLKVVVEAINMEGDQKWTPDYSDDSYKYNPYFWIDKDDSLPGGFGFSRSSYVGWGSCAFAGSRLCFRDRDRWKYAVEQFKDLYLEEILSLDRAAINQRVAQ